MANEPQVLRGIDWREAFPFTNIFRAFRIAIHPSKLVLALIALCLLYLGGRILDGIWPASSRAVPGEISMYEEDKGLEPLSDGIARAREQIEQSAARRLVSLNKLQKEDEALKLVRNDPAKAAEHLTFESGQSLQRDLVRAKEDYDNAVKPVNMTGEQIKKAKDNSRAAKKAAYEKARAEHLFASQIRGEGLFLAFFKYQAQQTNKIWSGVLTCNWLGGLGGRPDAAGDGVVISTLRFFTIAPSWALRYHWLYFLLFGTLFLFVWSLFGGAIARIAAVQVADEGRKLSVRQGLGFAVSKFLSFISAPLIPLIIIVGIGAVIAIVAGVAFLIPWLGEIAVGVLFFLAISAGFVITLVILGMAGGFNLMYPTIAVEGSDSFDAISRSFSYIYARPWRTLFYSAVAIAYGALTYLFVRLFIWLTLLITWFFVGLFIFREAGNGDSLWATILPRPSFASLPYTIDTLPLSWAGSLAYFFTAGWVYLTIAMLGAFAISFYFSANTIIYYLLRREVDATELDDVYLEQQEEEFTETPPAAAPAATEPAEPAPTPPPTA
jgi:hypothetical protein